MSNSTGSTSTSKGKTPPAPKTVLDKIVLAIRSQPPSSSGVSRSSISKYLKSELECDNANAIKAALKKGISSGKLIQTGQSFRVKGDQVVDVPKTEQIKIIDTKVGKNDGPSASRGDSIIVSYEGKLSDGTIFDSASTFEFVLGAGEVIKGWDQGILGMKIGGKRSLEIPSKLGYGKRGAPPEIPPNSDLFFSVTLKKIKTT